MRNLLDGGVVPFFLKAERQTIGRQAQEIRVGEIQAGSCEGIPIGVEARVVTGHGGGDLSPESRPQLRDATSRKNAPGDLIANMDQGGNGGRHQGIAFDHREAPS
jgi:hypothetical protein